MKKNIISIVGRANSGKTTLITGLIKHFKNKEFNIGVIKNMRHSFEMDKKGKDSYKYMESGAITSAVTNGDQYGMISNTPLTPLEISEKYMSDLDLVIIEGNKKSNTIKIEVVGDSDEIPLFEDGIKNIQFIVSDNFIETEMKVLKRDDIEDIAVEIKKILNLKY